MMPIAVVVRKRADDLRHHIRADGLIEDSGESAVGPHAELPGKAPRSEEHTSELQSRPHIVCRLLLEKKNEINVPSRRQVIQDSDLTDIARHEHADTFDRDDLAPICPAATTSVCSVCFGLFLGVAL